MSVQGTSASFRLVPVLLLRPVTLQPGDWQVLQPASLELQVDQCEVLLHLEGVCFSDAQLGPPSISVNLSPRV